MRARTTELVVTGLAPLSYNVAHCCQYSSPAKALVAIPAIWLGRTSYGFGAATRTPDPAPWRRRSSSGKTIPASSKADWIAHQSRDVAHSSRRGAPIWAVLAAEAYAGARPVHRRSPR